MASDILTVIVTNLTDLSSNPIPIEIYNKLIAPGRTLKIPAFLIDAKLRKIESAGLVSIGQLPTWYESAKKPDNVMSKDKIQARIAESLAVPKMVKEVPIGLKELKKEVKKEEKKELVKEVSKEG